MKKINLPKELVSFFDTNLKELEENYPGINKIVLLRFLDDLGVDHYLGATEEIHTKLLKGIPLEYITKKKFFYDFEFSLNEDVLIPRFETEILVHEAINLIKEKSINSVLDLGVGSGAIFINILKYLKENSLKMNYLHASDISQKALDVCEKNLTKLAWNKDLGQTELIKSDLYKNINNKYDLILSNPPYIKENADRAGVHRQTDAYEPHIALYLADREYDAWFDDFFKNTFHNLNENGYFIYEGHEDHLESQAKQLDSFGFKSIELIRDLTGRYRFIKAMKIKEV